MATGIQITPPSDITIGTTAIDSGVDTRVLFQQGGVVQQDANFTFNNTQKRLTLRAVGTAATDIPFAIRNSADTADLFSVRGNKVFNLADALTSDGFTTRLYSTTGILQLTASGNGLNLTSNFSALLNATNDVSLQTNATTRVYLNNTGLVGIGNTSPAARLDVRAQGALSTDIAFRVRNSADTQNLFSHDGTGSWIYRNNAGNNFVLWNAAGELQIGTSGSHTCSMTTSAGISRISTSSPIQSVQVASHGLYVYNNGNFQLEETSGVLQTSGRGGLSLKNAAVIPSLDTADRFTMYGADIVAGNAAPHFRTENGDIVKLFKGAALTASDGTLANAVTRIAELEARLQAHGLIA